MTIKGAQPAPKQKPHFFCGGGKGCHGDKSSTTNQSTEFHQKKKLVACEVYFKSAILDLMAEVIFRFFDLWMSRKNMPFKDLIFFWKHCSSGHASGWDGTTSCRFSTTLELSFLRDSRTSRTSHSHATLLSALRTFDAWFCCRITGNSRKSSFEGKRRLNKQTTRYQDPGNLR